MDTGFFAPGSRHAFDTFVQSAPVSAFSAAPRLYGTAGSAFGSNIGDAGGIRPAAGAARPAKASFATPSRSIAARRPVRIAAVANSGWPGRRLTSAAVNVAPGYRTSRAPGCEPS